ncbi:MAG: TraB domain-containing protein [Candidatus Woesearchaeota archaeon]
MKEIENLRIVGTSHISKKSADEVVKSIREYADIVALELDHNRFVGILRNERPGFFQMIKQIGLVGGTIAFFLHKMQKHMGKKVGVSPGTEFKKAIKVAMENKKRISLIDQPINITINKLKKSLTFKTIIKSFFFKTKNRYKINLKEVPDDETLEKLLEEMKERFPKLYHALVEERNQYMAKRLLKLMKTKENVLAVVGAGHEKGIYDIISKTLSYDNQDDNFSIIAS